MPLSEVSESGIPGSDRLVRTAWAPARLMVDGDGTDLVVREAGLAGGRYVEALQSGHLIPLTEPGLVVAEALSLLKDRPA